MNEQKKIDAIMCNNFVRAYLENFHNAFMATEKKIKKFYIAITWYQHLLSLDDHAFALFFSMPSLAGSYSNNESSFSCDR